MTKLKYQSLIDSMSLEDKIAFCSGADFWTTKAFEKYGIPSIHVGDGPHGIRKQISANANEPGQGKSVPSTCFPNSSAAACSWDTELLYEIGKAIGEEALQEGISVVLGPGVNIKRNPLCGRNFEYYSEDPLLAGKLAEYWIKGIQGNGIGVSLKHFAVNNQETSRMQSDSIIDERTLREIYLSAFEIAVKNAQPATVMCAYNSINGTFCSDNQFLLRKILRDEWGFAGVVMTDWGAMNDRVQAFKAGLDLEMPGGANYFDPVVREAVTNGALPEATINESVDRLLTLVFEIAQKSKHNYHYNCEQHHQLARKIAAQSAVLLKNEGDILPLKPTQRIAVIGALAQEAKFQGAGSSFINPTHTSNVLEGLDLYQAQYDFFPGYPIKGEIDEDLITEAVEGARTHDIALVCIGLTDEYESEGFDRENLNLPASHNELVKRLAQVNPNIVVLLFIGSPVILPWLANVKGVLNMYLPGQAGGLAVADLLFGTACPCGKLTESYPLQYEDVPSTGFFETGGKQAQYREGIYVGYRYYEKAKKPVAFPFGFGLSYTKFEFHDLILSRQEVHPGEEISVQVTIRNIGEVSGAEVVQLYVGYLSDPCYRPVKELKGFVKVFLRPGEERQISFTLNDRSFSIFDSQSKNWQVPCGDYLIQLGSSSQDIRLEKIVHVHGTELEEAKVPDWYLLPECPIVQQEFEQLLGHKIESLCNARPGYFSMTSSLHDMENSFVIKAVIKSIEKSVGKSYGGVDYSNPNFRMSVESSLSCPMKNLVTLSSGQMPVNVAQGLVHLANKHYFNGIKSFLKK